MESDSSEESSSDNHSKDHSEKYSGGSFGMIAKDRRSVGTPSFQDKDEKPELDVNMEGF